MVTGFIDRWLARRAFSALVTFMDRGGLGYADHNRCVAALDVIRAKMYTDWRSQ